MFSQVAPETVSGWEKIGVVGILIAAVWILIFDKRTAQKELVKEVQSLRDELKDTKKEVEELRRTNELALNRAWESRIQNNVSTAQNEPP
jgi:uncharacterized membrane-anchored protein YhcB (DUF1043 family)